MNIPSSRFLHSVCLALVLLSGSQRSYAQKISLVVGELSEDVPAISANVSNLTAIATAPDGDLIVAQGPYKGYLRRIDSSTGLITTIAGKGEGRPPEHNGLAIDSKIQYINGIAVDVNGDIYFTEDQWIRKITSATGRIETIAGNATQGYAGDNGPAVNATLWGPTGIVIKSGQLFFSDQYRVRKIDLSTGIITTVAGNGSSTRSGDGGPATDAGLSPAALTIDDASNLYIADSYTKIRQVNLNTGVISHFAGSGVCCGAVDNVLAVDATLFATGLAFSDGSVYVLNSTAVKRIDLSTEMITHFAGGSFGTSTGDGGAAVDATFSSMDIAISNNDIYVGDRTNGNIRKISAGIISTVAGIGNFGGDGEAAIHAVVKSPKGLAVNSENDLLFADTENNRIRKIDHVTGIVSTIAGNGSALASGDGGAGTAAGIAGPTALAVDDDDNIYVANATTIRKIDASTGIITSIAGNGTRGNTGNGGHATNAQIDLGYGDITVVNNNLYFASKDHYVVRKIDLSTGIITVVAGNGNAGDSGDEGVATEASIATPSDVAVSSNNDIFILNMGNVRKVDGETGIISTIPLVFPFTLSIEITPNGNLLVGGEFGVTEYTLTGEMVDNRATSDIGTSLWHLTYDKDGNFYFSDYLRNMIWKGVPRQVQTIQFNTIPTLKVGETYTLDDSNLSSSSGLSDFQYFFYSEEAAVFENNVITAVEPGVLYITVEHSGNDEYRPASAFQLVDVIKGDQLITFEKPADRVLGDPSFDLVAAASSTLPVIFSSTSDKISLTGKSVTMTAPGRVSILASQEGDGRYNAAETIEQSFCINPEKPVITASPTGKVLNASGTTGHQWFKDGVGIEGATSSSLVVSASGVYTVAITVDDCQSALSDSYTYDLVTGISLADTEYELAVYPNPAADELNLRVAGANEVSASVIDLFGRIVLTWNGSADTLITIPVSSLPMGTYQLRIISDGKSAAKRFVKK